MQELPLLSLVLAKRMHLPQEEGRDSNMEVEEEEQGRMRVVRLVHSTALLKSRKKRRKKRGGSDGGSPYSPLYSPTKCLQKKKGGGSDGGSARLL